MSTLYKVKDNLGKDDRVGFVTLLTNFVKTSSVQFNSIREKKNCVVVESGSISVVKCRSGVFDNVSLIF